MKIVSVILARGGSKEIPNKNIIPLNGKPLLSYVIEASKNADIDETWVSTDSKKIKEIAQLYGAQVIDRPNNISGDCSKSEEALKHFSDNVNFDILVFIQPTSPLLKASDINRGLQLFKNKRCNYDSVFSAYKEHWIPKWSMNIKPINWNIDNRPMRQEKEDKYIENGAFYITSKEQFLKSNLRYGGKIGIVEMPNYRSFQIDTLDDLKLIEKIL